VTTGDIITLLENGGAIIVFIVLLVTEQIVPKGRLDEVRAERDEWKRAAELNGARAEAGVLAGQTARDVLRALHDEFPGAGRDAKELG
jgi:hypothetical protein